MKIEPHNLGKKFNRNWVFKNLSVQFRSGFYVITGANGSGKSTLLQILWGQVPASAGEVLYHVNDKSIEVENIYTQVSIATPYMDLLDEYTLSEMVHFHFQFKKFQPPLHLEAVLCMMELEHVKDQKIGTFSSGMKQRAKLALALTSTCPFIFLDEPCTNLDSNGIAWYHNLLLQLPKDSVVLIASNQEYERPQKYELLKMEDFK